MKRVLLSMALCGFLHSTYSQDPDSLRSYDLEEIVISATRMNTDLKNIPQKVELISKAEIRSLPSENLADLLKRKTNLDIVQYTGMSSSVGMRGFSPTAHSRSYTLLLINGLPSGTTNMASIETENIERIEIIKGPYSVLYGSDAMGGVINIITESASEEQNGSISLAAGSFGTFKFSGDLSAKVGEKTNFDLGFSRRQQNQDYRIGTNNILKLSGTEKNILDPASYGDTMINSRYKLNHLNGGLRTQLNERWSIGAQAMYTMANEVETPGTYWGTYGESKKEINRLNLYGKLQRNSGRNIFAFNPYFTSENNPNYTDNSDSGFVSFISHVKEFGFKMHDNINVGDFQVLFGADLDVYHYASDRYSDATTPATPYVPNHRNSKGAIFTHLAYTKGGLLVNAGARLNKLTYKIEANESLNGSGGKEGYFAFNPSAGIQYALPVGLKFHGSFGTAFSVPDAFKVAGSYSVSEYFAEWDFWWISNYVGNQDLKPESSATYDIGLRYSAPNQLISADVTYFQTNHNNKIIEYNMGGDTVSYRNANDSRMSGIELNFTSNLGELFDHRFKLELYANYTGMLKNEVDETLSGSLGQDSTVTRHMLYTRKSNGNFGVLFDSYSGFSTRLHVRHMGPRLELDNFSLLRPDISPGEYYTRGGYTEADMILKHSAHLVFDYSIYYTLLSHYRVGITISNLLNENYSEKDGYNMTGRMITGSLRYSF